MKFKTKRIAQCLMCGIRIAAAKSPFCIVDSKRFNQPLMLRKHSIHRWVWARQVRTEEGVSAGAFELI